MPERLSWEEKRQIKRKADRVAREKKRIEDAALKQAALEPSREERRLRSESSSDKDSQRRKVETKLAPFYNAAKRFQQDSQSA